jgi:hypothetical protein
MLSISFGEEAANYRPVSDCVLKAVPFILNLKPKDNGIPKTLSYFMRLIVRKLF